MVVKYITLGDLIRNHPSVIGFISVPEGNFTKYFLLKRITNFETNFFIVSVSETCFQNTPTKAPDKTLLGDYLHFVVSAYHHLFLDEVVGYFLIYPWNLEDNHSLPRDF